MIYVKKSNEKLIQDKKKNHSLGCDGVRICDDRELPIRTTRDQELSCPWRTYPVNCSFLRHSQLTRVIEVRHRPNDGLPFFVTISQELETQSVSQESRCQETLSFLFMDSLDQLTVDAVTVDQSLLVWEHDDGCQRVCADYDLV